MLDQILGSHITNLQSALSRTSERQSLLMTNIANVNVPGYKRKDSDFYATLQGEMQTPAQRLQELQQTRGQEQSDKTSLRNDGNNVDMEHEMMSLSDTELRFQALTDMTSHTFSDLKAAIKEGR